MGKLLKDRKKVRKPRQNRRRESTTLAPELVDRHFIIYDARQVARLANNGTSLENGMRDAVCYDCHRKDKVSMRVDDVANSIIFTYCEECLDRGQKNNNLGVYTKRQPLCTKFKATR